MERMEIVSRLVAAQIENNGYAEIQKAFSLADSLIIYDREHPIPLSKEQIEAKHRMCSPNCIPEDLCPVCAEKAFPKATTRTAALAAS